MAEKKEKSKRELQVQLIVLLTAFGVLLLICTGYYFSRPIVIYEAEPQETAAGSSGTKALSAESSSVENRVLPASSSAADSSETPESGEQEVLQEKSIDLNAATVEELQKLSGIGPVLAERIVAYREEYGAFLDLNELTEVEGIGVKTLQKIQDYLYIK